MIGTVINNYRIVGILDSSGGMGVVYRAEHVTMGQKAVIKQLRPQFNQNPQVVVSFLDEARAAAAIDDPGIVRVFDQGTLTDGSAYLTMELLAGQTLRARLLRDGPLPPGVAISFVRQAARAVGAAHRHGIIHRDLKPENLFVCRDPEMPETLRIKVLDFGIAKLADGASGVQTQTGMPLGTPAYMAPEQWRSADRLDARTDIYALGCVLYELLVGHTPFPGPELPDFMDQHRFREPPPPSADNPALATFDRVIQRALAKSLDARFASMDELLAALPGRPGWTPPSWAHPGWSAPARLPTTPPAPPLNLADPASSAHGTRSLGPPAVSPDTANPGHRLGAPWILALLGLGVAIGAVAGVAVRGSPVAQVSPVSTPAVIEAPPSRDAPIAHGAALDGTIVEPPDARTLAAPDAALEDPAQPTAPPPNAAPNT